MKTSFNKEMFVPGLSEDESVENMNKVIAYATSNEICEALGPESLDFVKDFVHKILRYKEDRPARVTWYVEDPDRIKTLGIEGLDLFVADGPKEESTYSTALAVVMSFVVFSGSLTVVFRSDDVKELELYHFKMEDGNFSVVSKDSLKKDLEDVHAKDGYVIVPKEFLEDF